MLNLQDKMIELASYNVGCKIENGYYLITIHYEDNWKIIPPENSLIECATHNGATYYCAPVSEVSFDEVFISINETIEYNMDLERKVVLFKEKVSELQTIFAEEELDVLRTITFKYKKSKRKNKQTKIDETIVNDENEVTVKEDKCDEDIEDNNNENKLTFVEEVER